MLWSPKPSPEVVSVAVPFGASAVVLSGVPPSKKVTDPVIPGPLLTTLAVRASGCPKVPGLRLDPSGRRRRRLLDGHSNRGRGCRRVIAVAAVGDRKRVRSESERACAETETARGGNWLRGDDSGAVAQAKCARRRNSRTGQVARERDRRSDIYGVRRAAQRHGGLRKIDGLRPWCACAALIVRVATVADGECVRAARERVGRKGSNALSVQRCCLDTYGTVVQRHYARWNSCGAGHCCCESSPAFRRALSSPTASHSRLSRSSVPAVQEMRSCWARSSSHPP